MNPVVPDSSEAWPLLAHVPLLEDDDLQPDSSEATPPKVNESPLGDDNQRPPPPDSTGATPLVGNADQNCTTSDLIHLSEMRLQRETVTSSPRLQIRLGRSHQGRALPAGNNDKGQQSTATKETALKTVLIVGAAVVGGTAAVVLTPVAIAAMGFGAGGIAAGSFAAWCMSVAAKAGFGMAAVSALQSAGAAGLALGTQAVIGAAGAATIGGGAAAAAAALDKKENGTSKNPEDNAHRHDDKDDDNHNGDNDRGSPDGLDISPTRNEEDTTSKESVGGTKLETLDHEMAVKKCRDKSQQVTTLDFAVRTTEETGQDSNDSDTINCHTRELKF